MDGIPYKKGTMYTSANKDILLKKLECDIRDGVLTIADKVDAGTVVCYLQWYQDTPHYYQKPYEDLTRDLKLSFWGEKKGTRLGEYKILAVYDLW